MTPEPFELKADDDPHKKADSQQRLVSFRSFKLEDVRDRERSGRSGAGGVLREMRAMDVTQLAHLIALAMKIILEKK